jgi:hypothetical protein
VGPKEGDHECCFVGRILGEADGVLVGKLEGDMEGTNDGRVLGKADGTALAVGFLVGEEEGGDEAIVVGISLAALVGETDSDGCAEGAADGSYVGLLVDGA